MAQRLAAVRRRSLVGRQAELGLVADLLRDTDRDVAVLFVHGPGGVGKSALLHAVADLAGASDLDAVLLDAGDVDPTPAGLEAAVARALGAPTGGHATASLTELLPARAVLLLDTFEALAGIEGWVWRQFLPSLPAGVLTVAAGRRAPSEQWRTAAGWDTLLRLLPLRNLPPQDAAELLRARHVPAGDIDGIVRSTRGHPLALVIAADTVTAGDGTPNAASVLDDHPDAAARLLGRFVDDVVTSEQRHALHVCGHARRVDRALLREVLATDEATADELLAWLRDRPYVSSHPDGLAVHDVVRDALDRDLRWRDRDAFVTLHGRIRAVSVRRMHARTGTAQQQAAADLLFLHRGNPLAASLYRFDELGTLSARPFAPADEAAVAALFEQLTGPAYAAVAQRWRTAQPEAFHVIEDPSATIAGTAGFVRLERAGDDERAADPIASHVAQVLAERRPPADGEVTLYHLFAHDHADGHPGPVGDVLAMLSLREWAVARLGWAFLATPFEAAWAPMWTYIGFEPLASLRLDDGTEIGCWGRDFRRSDYGDWLAAMARHELDDTGTAPPPTAAPIALSRPDFAAQVRQLLRDLHRVDRLADNPLTRSRLAADPSPDTSAASDAGGSSATSDPRGGEVAAVTRLVAAVRLAVAQLADDPRDRRGSRALDRTYVRPAASQERAAEALGLPFSTYRRHLQEGIERLTELLWAWELQGVPATVRPTADATQG